MQSNVQKDHRIGVSRSKNFLKRLKHIDSGSPLLTVEIVAPEVILMENITEKSDIWSLGCTVIEMLTGNPPYAKMNSLSVMYRIVHDDHPLLPETIKNKKLVDFLVACFSRDITKRPSASEAAYHPWIAEFWRTEAHELQRQRRCEQTMFYRPSSDSRPSSPMSSSYEGSREGHHLSEKDKSESEASPRKPRENFVKRIRNECIIS